MRSFGFIRFIGIFGLACGVGPAAEVPELLATYCYNCHSTEEQKGDLDLQSSDIYQDPSVWEHVLDQMELDEMPPKKAKQMSPEEEAKVTAWIRKTLDEIALKNAGDPGPVILRRLSNMEYTYTLRDLTGVPSLDPLREFPVDGAAGEGFTNAGAGLVMSPALLAKYLDAAKEVAAHAVFTPRGFRWSSSVQRPDWTEESMAAVRDFYARFTAVSEGGHTVKDGIKLDIGNGGGRIPLDRYLNALQHNGSKEGLSQKYLGLLRGALEGGEPSQLLDALRQKYKTGALTPKDVAPWQEALWKFGSVGHVGKGGEAKVWQEAVSPVADQQEHRLKLKPGEDNSVILITGTAGDGTEGDEVIWENARLVAPGRPDLPIGDLPELMALLEKERTNIISNAENSLRVLASSDPANGEIHLDAWRDYLGLVPKKLENLLSNKIPKVGDYDFIQGWAGPKGVSVTANPTDAAVRVPGSMIPHSISTHPSPTDESVIAWLSPVTGALRVEAKVTRGHPECGTGVTWALEIHRGGTIERLASGVAKNGAPIQVGPFADVQVKPGEYVAMVVGPLNGSHTCGLTTVDLTISQGESKWDLATDVSPNILSANPNGNWHFAARTVRPASLSNLPPAMGAWRNQPNLENAAAVRAHLEKEFPLTHPLLERTIRTFKPTGTPKTITTHGHSVSTIVIPKVLAGVGVEFVATARLADPAVGSVQTLVTSDSTSTAPVDLLPGVLVITGPESNSRRRFERAFEDFRNLFPAALCYTRIVPVDEVVTLALYYREDFHLQRLMLTDEEAAELDRLWEELLFVSEAPLKQVDAFEQLLQYATQLRSGPPTEYEVMKDGIMKAAQDFENKRKEAEIIQGEAVIEFAAKAWRRPLKPEEVSALKSFSPTLMLVRVLASPSFLYKAEDIPEKTAPVNDWELATRLSYFLWSSAPDGELRALAESGKLRDPGVLAAQVRRMLSSPKIERLATEFGCQWLHVRDVATLDEKSERHFPGFLDVRESMQEEVARFFSDLFQSNASVLSLLEADHTFVNGPLAGHYGLKQEGSEWRRVEGMRALGRGGILGFAAPLAKHSGASRTSAILRGTWLSEVILGDKLPPPPRGVPVLPEESPEGLTERQLIERHTSDPNCASCHKRIDPYGFALEGFDAIGRMRQAETHTTLYDGTKIAGLEELREYLLTTRKRDFLEQFCRKLVGYALGRSYRLSDRPLVESMIQGDLSSGNLVEQVVLSRQFLAVRGKTEDELR
jgi:hypothetical protein